MIRAIAISARPKPWKTVLLAELDAMLAKDLHIDYYCALAYIRERLRAKV
jgi:hypothetical protein